PGPAESASLVAIPHAPRDPRRQSARRDAFDEVLHGPSGAREQDGQVEHASGAVHGASTANESVRRRRSVTSLVRTGSVLRATSITASMSIGPLDSGSHLSVRH